VRLHVGWIGAAVRFGEAEAGDGFALGHARQPALFLLFAAERVNWIHAQTGLHGYEAAQARIAALQLLADQSIRHTVQACTAVAFDRTAQQAKLGHAGDQLAREALVFEAVAHDGNDLVVDEFRDRVLNQPLVVAEHAANVVQIDRIEFGGGGRRGFGFG
jgi:hypothetical protein